MISEIKGPIIIAYSIEGPICDSPSGLSQLF